MINDEELPRFLDIMVDSYKKHLLDNEYITSDVHVPAMVKSRLEMVL